MKPSYVGVSGVVSQDQVNHILNVTGGTLSGDYKVMIGALMTASTLDGRPVKERGPRYVPVRELSQLFLKHPLLFNVVHYHCSGDRRARLKRDVDQIVKLAGSNIDGIQFNIREPVHSEIDAIREAYPKLKLILQLGSKVLDLYGDHQDLVKYIEHYDVDYVLHDPSGGNAEPFKIGDSFLALSAIQKNFPSINLVQAGGIHGSNLDRLTGLFEQFPNLSFDAEGGLMTDHVLDPAKLDSYLIGSKSFLQDVLGVSSR